MLLRAPCERVRSPLLKAALRKTCPVPHWLYFLLPQKFGCDGILGSLAREDHCGVCNGNGKSCKVIKGDFNHTRGAGKSVYFKYSQNHWLFDYFEHWDL